MFTALDWAILVLYMLGTIAVGLWAARGGKNFNDYMFGGGRVPWIAVGISIIATSVSATTFLGAPADVFGVNMTFLMFQFGALISIFVVGFVFIPQFRKAGIVSAYELLERRFSVSVRRVAALFYSLHLLLRTGILLYAPSIVLASILGIQLWEAIMLSAAVATLYTWYGGIKSVIWTDVLQFFVFFGAGVLVLVIVAHAVGGANHLYQAAVSAGKTHWIDFSLDLSKDRTLISAGLAYAVLEVAIRGCDQQFVQRYLSCQGISEANRSSILSMVLGALVSLLFYWVGAALFVYYRVAGQGNLPAEIGMNDVFPHFILNDLPPGITGLVVAAIYAAAMSSLSSAISALANTTESDILHKHRQAPGNLRRAKWFSLAWAAAGILAALIAAKTQGSLLKNAVFFTGLFTGPLLALFVLAFFRPKTNPHAVLTGALLGMASLILFNRIPILPSWEPPFAGVISWPWNPGIAMSVTLLCAILLDVLLPRRRHIDITV
ncbi:MAG TPA: sodium/solute symporter [Fibrobacteraceae bacterium]|nr:sodium/solute symporter [Fibrobacteraceae bacterium]